MSEENINLFEEKIDKNSNNGINLKEKNELEENISKNILEKSSQEINKLENISKEENTQKSKEDKLKHFTSFEVNAIYQILINKIMPIGFKLETEENLLKIDDKKQKGYLHRKHKKGNNSNIGNKKVNENYNISIQNKISEDNNENKNNINIKHRKSRKKSFHLLSEGNNLEDNKDNKNTGLRRMSRTHKPKIIEDLGYIDKDVIKGKSNPLFRAINKNCEKGIMKIKKIPYYSFFYNSSKPDDPSLTKIEKNIKDFKYQSTYEFIMDLRKLWNHFFKVYSDQTEIKERIAEMCQISEELYWDLENNKIEKVEIEEVSKKVDNLEKKLREIKGNSLQFNVGNYSLKKTNSNERTMSLNEKTIIKNNIKLLTIEQKKGIANILRDTIDMANKKVLEFDIDKLNNKKLKQLDEYVKNCLRDNNLNQEKMALVQKLKNDLTDNNIKDNNDEKNNDKDNYDIENDIDNSSNSDSGSSMSL